MQDEWWTVYGTSPDLTSLGMYESVEVLTPTSTLVKYGVRFLSLSYCIAMVARIVRGVQTRAGIAFICGVYKCDCADSASRAGVY